MKNELTKIAEYAKRRGYRVEIKSDHVVAANENGAVRTASMKTMQKVCEK